MRRIFTLFAIMFLGLAVCGFAPSPAQAKTTFVTIGTGGITGVYYPTGGAIARIVNKKKDEYGIRCTVESTGGSVFNVNAVMAGDLEFGVVQSDRQYQAINGLAEWDGKAQKKLRAVFSIHPETVTLVAAEDAGIMTIADLKGKTVNIGNPGSGQRGNAEDVLRLYGVDFNKDFSAEALQQAEASRALVDQKIDAFFFTVGNPSAAIEEPAQSVDLDIVPINSDAVKKFVAEHPYYIMTKIPAGTYKGVDKDAETYAVTATVVTNESVPEDVVYDMVKTVFDNLDELKASHAAFRNLNPKEMLGGLSAPLHPGALKYYKEKGWK